MNRLTLLLASMVLLALPTEPALSQGGCPVAALQTNCPPVSMPEPSSFVLLAAGLGALGIFLAFRHLRASNTIDK